MQNVKIVNRSKPKLTQMSISVSGDDLEYTIVNSQQRDIEGST